MKKTRLEIGDVMQISPDHEAFGGALFLVTEPKPWGAQGVIYSCYEFEATRFKGRAFLRVKFEDMEFVGKMQWMQKNDIETEEEDDDVTSGTE